MGYFHCIPDNYVPMLNNLIDATVLSAKSDSVVIFVFAKLSETYKR